MSAYDEPLVSVSLLTYNQQEFIGAAIDSVLAQNYERLEIVIGDDCSQDDTWSIILEYQNKFPDLIKPFRNEKNLGITKNSNEILKRCTGKYIAFFAGDDIFLPGKIRKQVDVMEKDTSIVLCYHDIEMFNSETGKTIRYWNHGLLSTPPVVGFAREVTKAVVEKGTAFMAALSVMTRAEAVPVSGFDLRILVASDWLMWIEILANAKPEATVVFLDEVLARYRRHDLNVTNQAKRYYSDVLTTLALVESNYPWLIDEVSRHEAEARYSRGIQFICDSDFALGRKYLIQSAKRRLFSWKWFAWFAASYIPMLRPRK